jgi:hypothetical protein
MELLEGETLAHRLEKGPLTVADVLRLGAQIAEALDVAHRRGIIHRDLKPGHHPRLPGARATWHDRRSRSLAFSAPCARAAPLNRQSHRLLAEMAVDYLRNRS